MSLVSDASAPRTNPFAELWRRLRQLYARRETVRFLVGANLKAGHRDKVLGHLWNLLDPAMFMLVYFFVFGVLFKMSERGKPGAFMIYIFVGVLSWRFLAGAVAEATNCVRGNRGLIHEINFPKAIFPISIGLSRMYDFLWGLASRLRGHCVARILRCRWFPMRPRRGQTPLPNCGDG